ncbi:ATP-binding cassette domain-containing protein [Pseudooceanicola nanhaiensis]|uniref:ATP-binding cassette domain-containing protein n=1 Tax=Pseudooceanicola nanhaiensis TaxID=375761 RepID=UPI001CD61C32|nr:ATP-binding cassette domain-containing protein [Pseudooceanicola nanhaiensis]MCA0922940.1 ATP-binding cassette domain-containing protein [Pseudooceanicola nanhaiensis]
MSDDILLSARDIRRDFRVSAGFGKRARTVSAVRGVSLDVKKGGVLGIVGESGCGKSTLAKILLGLDEATSGEVLFQGKTMAGMNRKTRARHIQPIFQDPYLSLNPRKRVDTIIGLPLRVAGVPERDIRTRVAEMMELTGLPLRLAGTFPSQMSGGQRQRVAIARALISRPELVVCDEPTSALDVSIQAQILNLLQDLRRELGLTYVLISHNLAVVEHIATEVMVMNHGEVVEHRPTAELFARPGSAYTQMLLDSILTPEPGKGLPEIALTDA